MIVTFVQLNTPTTPSGKARTSACNALPFGLTFALQTARTGLAGASLLSTIERKEGALHTNNVARRSGVKWGNKEV